MTDTSTEPVVAPSSTTPDPPPAPTEQTPAPAKKASAQVAHTPGGVPVLPLALSTANTAATLVAGAALAGGPLAASVTALGTAAAAGTTAALHRHRDRPARKTTARAPLPGARRRSSARTPSGTSGAGKGGARAGTGRAGAGRSGGRPVSLTKSRTGTGAARGSGIRATSAGRGAAGRVGAVKSLRAAQRQAAPTRAAARTQQAAARRSVADARRANGPASRAAARPGARSGGGRAGGALARGVGRLGQGRQAAIGRTRALRDARTGRKVDAARGGLQQRARAKRIAALSASARRSARFALWRSHGRRHSRKALVGLLAAALGVLNLVVGGALRAVGVPVPKDGGRRVYRRLAGSADAAHAERAAKVAADLAAAEEAAEGQVAAEEDESAEVGDTVARPEHPAPTSASTIASSEGENVSGFRFEEHAAEMEQAAQGYEPDGCMEILGMVENLPEALTSIANTMRILAERSDSEFPLEKEVAAGFNEIFTALQTAVSAAEDLGPSFRTAHEQDIARHEDPRNGTDAEKGWNV